MLSVKNRKGFTLIEVVVVAGIIAILAGILVPVILNQIDEARIAKARGDIKAIQSAIAMFRKDNSCYPYRHDGTSPLNGLNSLLVSNMNRLIPDANLAPGWIAAGVASTDSLAKHMRINDHGYPAAMWKGPYISEENADPWGNTYMIGAKNFDDTTGLPVWIISAGPDGILQTDIDVDPLVGDDIGIRVK